MASQTPKSGKQATPDDGVAQEIQRRTDTAEDQGFLGTEVDPTPNAHYTFAGQAAGKPTPETDGATAKAARAASHG
ncbi:hypothetical protein [Streptomyces sp. Ac-502]|uniref:hypothetical protein n=1 Tax=Streptomyces sp. Ac-502 TaxID=3342801 RepID=UPI0038629AB8